MWSPLPLVRRYLFWPSKVYISVIITHITHYKSCLTFLCGLDTSSAGIWALLIVLSYYLAEITELLGLHSGSSTHSWCNSCLSVAWISYNKFRHTKRDLSVSILFNVCIQSCAILFDVYSILYAIHNIGTCILISLM